MDILVLRVILFILMFLYFLYTLFRNLIFTIGLIKAYKAKCSVISIGNISVGGTGKTPVTEFIARYLKKKGCKPVIISRGYKAGRRKKTGKKLPKPIEVQNLSSYGKKLYEVVGDEPALLYSHLADIPILVDRKRVRAAKYAEEKLNPDIILLDDGFQHRYLFRDLDIIILKKERNRCLLPLGPLREGKASIKRADIVMVNEGSLPFLKGLTAPIIKFRYEVSEIVYPHTGKAMPLADLKKRRVFLFSGIGNPGFFRKTVEPLVGEIKGEMSFPDHHSYSYQDLTAIEIRSRNKTAEIILTTEKDAVKLAGKDIPPEVMVVRIEAKILEGEKILFEKLDSLLSKKETTDLSL
jgi:tetraacyldisaccharide 4'-kinase